jgi:hypothetical protein
MPLHTIITAANTVSRASPAFSDGAAIITDNECDFDHGDGDR